MRGSLLLVLSLLAAVVWAPPPLVITNIQTNTMEADTNSDNTELTSTSSSSSSSELIGSEDVTTIDSDSGENQTERWEDNLVGNELKETSTEEYDAVIGIYAMMDNEMNLLEDEENKSSGTPGDEIEMTTTESIKDEKNPKYSVEINKSDQYLTKTSTTTIPDFEVTKNIEITTTSTTTTSTTSPTSTTTTTTTTATTSTSTDSALDQNTSKILKKKKAENIRGDERNSLISALGPIDFTKADLDTLVLTPRQRLAISQELEYQQLGLPPFSDPSPWQRLSRDQQEAFNQKYLALSPELQEFSKSQFLTLSERAQKHAYNAFLALDIKTLAAVIETEKKIINSEREKEEEVPPHQVSNDLREQSRSSNVGVRVNNFDFPEATKPTRKERKTIRKYDPRRQRRPHFQVNPVKPRERLGVTGSTGRAQELHLQYAREQLLQAIHLQACLSHPATCH